MKKKYLALLLIAALTVTSTGGMAFAVNAADFSAEDVQEETEMQPEADTAETDTAEEESAEEIQNISEPEEELTEETPESGNEETFSAGEEDNFSDGAEEAGDTFASNSIIPDNVQKIEIGKKYKVDIEKGGQKVWFAFTAKKTGSYFLTTDTSAEEFEERSGTPTLYCYNKHDVSSENDCWKENTGGYNSGRDSRIAISVEKGKTYYFCASYISEYKTGSCKVKLEEATFPVSVKINTDKIVQKEYQADLEGCYLSGAELTAEYADGKSKQIVTFSYRGDDEYDSYGNKFSYKLFRTDEASEYGDDPGVALEAGEYKPVFFCNDEKIETDSNYTFKVVESDNLPILHIGDNNEVESPADREMWYSFTAPETATYLFSPIEQIQVVEKKEDGLEYISSEEIGKGKTFDLEKGKTYYVGLTSVGSWELDTTKWNVTIEEKAEISSMAFSEKELKFTYGLDNVYEDTYIGNLTTYYNNGQNPDTVGVYLNGVSMDRYGNCISAKVIDNSTGKAWNKTGALHAGTYKLSYSYENGESTVTSEVIPITVQKKVDFGSYSKLVQGKNTIKTTMGDGLFLDTWYALDVKKAGVYQFKDLSSENNSEELYAIVKKIDQKQEVQNLANWNGKSKKLDAGKYLIAFRCGGEIESVIDFKSATETSHTWDKGKITKKPTCKSTGTKTFTCTTCGETKTQTIPKTKTHKFSSWKKISDATVFAPQKQRRTCTVCGKTEDKNVGSKLKATIRLNVTSITLQQNQTTKSVKVTMANGDSVKSWASSDQKIASVDKNGMIKALKPGTSKLTVTLKSGKKATCTVKVVKAEKRTLTVNKSKVTLSRGKSTTLTVKGSPAVSAKAKTVKFSSSNSKIAAVTGAGKIVAKKAGTCKIYVKGNGITKVVTVTVKNK